MTLTPTRTTYQFDAAVLLALQDVASQLGRRMKPRHRKRARRELCTLADKLDHDGWADRVVRLRSPGPYSRIKREDYARARALRLLVSTLL